MRDVSDSRTAQYLKAHLVAHLFHVAFLDLHDVCMRGAAIEGLEQLGDTPALALGFAFNLSGVSASVTFAVAAC